MNNGVSKKLCMTAVGVGLVAQLATNATDKLPYAIIIGVMCIAYKAVQGFIDWKNNKLEN